MSSHAIIRGTPKAHRRSISAVSIVAANGFPAIRTLEPQHREQRPSTSRADPGCFLEKKCPQSTPSVRRSVQSAGSRPRSIARPNGDSFSTRRTLSRADHDVDVAEWASFFRRGKMYAVKKPHSQRIFWKNRGVIKYREQRFTNVWSKRFRGSSSSQVFWTYRGVIK